MLLSFAIPAYNRPELLVEAVRSIAGLRRAVLGTDSEIVICAEPVLPGGQPASDELQATLVRAAGSVPLRVLRNPMQLGAVANWNRCLAEARGEWVTILHEDDLLYPHYLDLIKDSLSGEAVAVAVGVDSGATPPQTVTVPAPGESRREAYPRRYFIKSSMTPFPGVMIRRDVALRLGGFDERWGPLADYEFWYRLACAGPVEIVRSRGAFYRVAPGQWTETAWVRMVRLTHLLRLRIARDQFSRSRRLGRWLARFFTYRNARSYARRFPERPAALTRALSLRRSPGSWLPSGWVWQAVKYMR